MDDVSRSRTEGARRHPGSRTPITRHGRVGSLAEAAAARGVEPARHRQDARRAARRGRLPVRAGPRRPRDLWPKLRAHLGVNRVSMPDADDRPRGHRLRARHDHAVRVAADAGRSSPTPRSPGARCRSARGRTGWRPRSAADDAGRASSTPRSPTSPTPADPTCDSSGAGTRRRQDSRIGMRTPRSLRRPRSALS